MLVGHQVVVVTCRPSICSTPVLLRLLVLLVDVLNICQGLRTSGAFIVDEALGKGCFGQGQQILRLYETDINS
jgi:hypothetical protein